MKDIEIFTSGFRYKDDCIRIQNILKDRGYNATLKQCEELWQCYSDNMCAGWMCLDDDDEDVLDNISGFIIN